MKMNLITIIYWISSVILGFLTGALFIKWYLAIILFVMFTLMFIIGEYYYWLRKYGK